MQEERFTLLAGLYLSGEASPAEREELDELLRQHPEWEARLEALHRIWRSRQKGLVKKEDAYQRHLQRLSAHLDAAPLDANPPAVSPADRQDTPSSTNIHPSSANTHPSLPPNVPFRKWWIAVAAAASLTGAIFFIQRYTTRPTTGPIASRTISTPPGARTKLSLPDGTTVLLNADSRLTYDEHFAGDNRDIQLSGEAYFDVAKDPHHPFLIHTSVIDIKVLGTAFNVRSYENEKITETDLLQGAVEVTLHNKPDKRIILKPNEKLTVRNDQVNIDTGEATASDNSDSPLITVGKVHFQKKDSSITETLWTKNRLAFDNTTLEDVALQLQRWYGITVVIRDEKLKDIRLNAFFGQEDLRQVMEALSIAGNFRYTIHNNEVIITP
jgi:ferric-dicitrate binding protein FerR (iron transport regulator)